MTALTWTDDLALQHPQVDATHEEFVALLAATHTALDGPDSMLLGHFETLVAHTVEHFAQEERWMQATGFAPDNCHTLQHKAVLGVMQACAKRAQPVVPVPALAMDGVLDSGANTADDTEGDVPDFEPLRMAVGELANWFPQHAQMMDAALVQHLALVGFDAATGLCSAHVVGADGQPMAGCGAASCG